jgi:L-2-hydroxycarboxylate dehydrogenase (NAD+)
MQIGAFVEPDEFKRQVDEYRRVFMSTKPVSGTEGVLLPGDPEREAEAIRREHGIPILPPVVADLRHIAKTLQIEL